MFARADLDRNAVPGVDQDESVFVGHVVSRKNRPPAGERLLAEIVGNGCPFVAADGLCLDNHFAAFEFDAGKFVDRRFHQRNAGLLELGMRPIVQGDGAVFVLQEQSRVFLQQRVHGLLDRGGEAAVDRRPMHVPCRVPPRQAMHARDRQAQRIEEPIDRRDLAAGDDRDRAAEQRVEMHQRLTGREVQPHLVRTIGDRDEGAVEIQKQGNALGIAKVGQGHNWAFEHQFA